MKARKTELAGAALWLARLDEVEPEEWRRLYGQMDRERQERCLRYRREGDRRRCILADGLARLALAGESGLDPASLTLEREPGGKPFAPGLDLRFSLSHSGAVVACAVSGRPVGADIQRQRPVSPAMTGRLARAGYRGTTQEDFFTWWVRQEAAGKLSGRGLSLAPLPPGPEFQSGTLEEPDGRYFYCVCVG